MFLPGHLLKCLWTRNWSPKLSKKPQPLSLNKRVHSGCPVKTGEGCVRKGIWLKTFAKWMCRSCSPVVPCRDKLKEKKKVITWLNLIYRAQNLSPTAPSWFVFKSLTLPVLSAAPSFLWINEWRHLCCAAVSEIYCSTGLALSVGVTVTLMHCYHTS